MKRLLITHKKKTIFLLLTALCYSVFSVLAAEYLGQLIDSVEGQTINKLLWFVVVGISLVGFVFLTDLLNEFTVERIKNHLISEIRSGFMYSLLTHRSIEEIRQQKNSEYVSSLTNDLETLEENYITPFLNTLAQMVMIIVSATIITRHNAWITLAIIGFSLIIIFIPSKMTQLMQTSQEAYIQKHTEYLEMLDEVMEGVEIIYSTQSQQMAKKIFTKTNEDYTRNKTNFGKSQILNWITSQNLSLISQYIVMFICIYFVMQQQLTIGVLFTIINTMNILIYPITNIFQYVQQIRSSSDLFKQYQPYTLDVEEPTQSTFIWNKHTVKGKHLSVVQEEHPILSDIQFELEYGKKYYIIGKSGSGKSTLAKLLAGYISPTEGSISPSSMERLQGIGLCEQNPALFNLSIKENIILNKEWNARKYENIQTICAIEDFDKTNEPIGKKGSRLSSGQRSRVALARALYQEKDMLILDESFGPLDKQIATKVEKNLLSNYKGTLCVISHHYTIETLKQYDHLMILSEGSLVLTKPMSELFEQADVFAYLQAFL